MGLTLLLILVLAIMTSSLTHTVAKSKGLDAESWAWAGFFLGIFALIAASGMADKKQRSYMRFLAEAQGWKDKEPNAEMAVNQGEGALAGNGVKEDYEIVVSMYKGKGGAGEPDFKKSNLLARTILLVNTEGEKLAYFANRQGYWYFVELYQ